MRSVLNFLKSNLFNIVCGVVVLASIGIGVLGMTKMSDVEDELRSIKSLHGQFSAAARSPANDKTIDAEKARVDLVKRYYDDLLEVAHGFNQYKPLTPPEGERFFPAPTEDGKLGFRSIYLVEFEGMYERLNAGHPPSASDIADMQATMDEEKRAEQAFGVDEDEGLPDAEEASSSGDAEPEHPSGLITVAAARESAAARAAIRRARSLYCYADINTAFQYNARIVQQGQFTVPAATDMWDAQVSLWVQKDVVESLARVNDLIAQRLKDEGKTPWVGVLPVKELISIRVSPYLPVEGSRPMRKLTGSDPADPIGSSDFVFTQDTSNDMYDLVQFTLKMVVDPRDLPLIIDEICKDKFHTLLNIEYGYEPAALVSLDMTGKIFGGEPAVKVLLDFETIFFGDVYRRLMPDEVLEAIGRERPGDDGD